MKHLFFTTLFLASVLSVRASALQLLWSGVGSSDVLRETFEGTGTPAGFSVASGTPNFDDTSPVGAGAESFNISTGSAQTNVALSPALGELWVYYMVYHTGTQDVAVSLRFRQAAGDLGNLNFNPTDDMQIAHGSTVANDTGSPWTIDTWYHVWMHYVKATVAANDGILTVYHSTTATRPGSPTLNITTGTSTLDVVALRFQNGSGMILNIDNFLVATTEIGSNPF